MGIEKLPLEEALADSPQIRNLVNLFEKDAFLLRDYIGKIQNCCLRISNAQKELSSATENLSALLKVYEQQRFPLENDGSLLCETLNNFSTYLDELSSVQQILAAHLDDSTMFPLNKFLQSDLNEVVAMSDLRKHACNEHEQAIARYSKMSKKKDNNKARREANDDLFDYRKNFHHTSLQYFSLLNAIQYKRKTCLIEPLIGMLHAVKVYFDMGKEVFANAICDDFLSNISAGVHSVQAEMAEDAQVCAQQIQLIRAENQSRYYPECSPDVLPSPPNLRMNQKAGYLHMRTKQALLINKWERCYFFIQGGNLMCQAKDEVAGSLVLDLNDEGGAHVELSNVDDRHFVFQVSFPSNRKTVILQAESDRERDEWMATIRNAARDSGYVRDKSAHKERKSVTFKDDLPSQLVPADGDLAIDPGSPSVSSAESSRQSAVRVVPASFGVPLVVALPPLSSPQSQPHSNGGFDKDNPIQFDFLSPGEANRQFLQGNQDGPPKRINPFDQASSDAVTENKVDEKAAFSQSFIVRFLGSIEVISDRGEQLILDCIRHIMEARAVKNFFKTTEFCFVVSSEAIRLLNPSDYSIRTEFNLEDISYWTPHKENVRLFGFITRDTNFSSGLERPRFACHVFESESSGEVICESISKATRMAFEALMATKSLEERKSHEQSVFMSNLQELPDKLATPRMTPDGLSLLLESAAIGNVVAPPLDRPIMVSPGKGKKMIDGAVADCESEA